MKTLKKIGASLLVLLLLYTCFSGATQVKSQTQTNIDVYAEASGHIDYGNAQLAYETSLRDNQNGTYTAIITFPHSDDIEVASENRTTVRSGWYTANVAGDYLVELWGGSGGDGSDTSYSNGGKGGKGGYVYGVLSLEAGETIYYTIGGAGGTVDIEEEGGAGGGGSHGDTGNHKVGGGGGYSAIYKYASGEFESSYLNDAGEMTADTISEADRLTHCLMIAGGGGGGGAGNAYTSESELSATGAQGGNGGNILTSLSGDVIGVGAYYAGENGKSSGPDVSYIGYGGTNIPGENSNTTLGMFPASAGSNWIDGGNGGNGNLRGGAGGAGFAGGGGGTSAGYLIAKNIGGGGGGSSYISYQVSTTLSQVAQNALQNGGEDPKPDNGGTVKITFVGTVNDTVAYLRDINLSASASSYFDIQSVSYSGIGSLTYNASSFTVSHAAAFEGIHGSEMKIEVLLKVKSGFPGGNDVPLFSGDVVNVLASGKSNQTVNLHNNSGYVNVGYAFQAIGNTCQIDETHTSVKGSDLYTKNSVYTNTAANAGSGLYRFISSISDYYVNGATPLATYAPSVSTMYTVSFTVTPTEGSIATIGERLETKTFSAAASISVKKSNSIQINGNDISITKELSYVNNKYVFKTNVQSLVTKPYTSELQKNSQSAVTILSSTSNKTFTASASGYYLVQVWGGDGGDGGRDYNKKSNPTGALGGYVYGVVYLNAGQVLTASIGTDGAKGSDSTNTQYKDGDTATGGIGGTPTYVTITSGSSNVGSVVVLAGGGGGAGASVNRGTTVSQTNYAAGTDATTNTNPQDVSGISNPSSYKGGNGQKGYYSGSLTGAFYGGAAGASAANLRNTSVATTSYSGISSDSQVLLSAANGVQTSGSLVNGDANGKAIITPLDKTVTTLTVNGFSQLTIDFSKYFAVESVSYSGVSSADQYTVNSANLLTVSNIMPSGAGSYTDGRTMMNLDFSVIVTLSPISGFLGGNDVPVLDSQVILKQNDSDGNTANDSATVPVQNDTDYANVAIPSFITLETHDVEYVLGDAGYSQSDLYTYTKPTGSMDTIGDFVTITATPTCNTTFNGAPTSDVVYSFTASIAPKNARSKAVVIPEASAITLKQNAKIHVKTKVNLSLSNLTSDLASPTVVELGQRISGKLTPASGYMLPDDISVSVNGTGVTDYDYDSYTGEFSIPGTLVNGIVTISGAGVKKSVEYTINFVYSLDPADESAVGMHSASYELGEAVENWTLTYTPTSFFGYEFVWEEVPATMPAHNVWVSGSYVPKQYSFKINYVDENGVQLATPVDTTMIFGEYYSFVSPTVNKYTPDTASVIGYISGDINITVVYTRNAPGQIVISYLNRKTGMTIATQYDGNVDIGDPYSIASPTVYGYTPETAVVSGTMTEDGISKVVYYDPNQVAVSFETNGGSACDNRTLEFDNIYGYNVGISDFEALPMPIKMGNRFEGWYLDAELTNHITESSAVTVSESHTLYAKWHAMEFSLTIKYQYEDGQKAADDYVFNGYVDDAYSIPSPSVSHCTPDKATVTGNIIAQNQIVYVTYIGNQYQLIIKYVDATTGAELSGLTRYTGNHKYRSTYSITSPALPSGYASCSSPVVSGTMPGQNTTITVYYYEIQPVISVTISWDSMTFDYSYGDWNTDYHTYEPGEFTPQTVDANKINIVNNNESTVPITAEFSYASKEAYTDVNGSFEDAGGQNVSGGISLNPNQTKAVYLKLSGKLPDDAYSRTLKVGLCTVIIKTGASGK